jgi:ferredoxin-NADP reductase
MTLARPWRFTAGQHAYLYLPRVGWWTSHPFSVAWCDEEDDEVVSNDVRSDMEKEAVTIRTTNRKRQSWQRKQSNIYFIVRRKKGFTEKLWNKAATSPNGVFTTRAFAEGPYNEQKLHSYGTVLLFAAGVGITHSVPHLRDLVQGYGDGTVATRKVVLVWILQSPEHLEWIREWMTEILGLPHRREVLKILLYVSRPQDNREIYSPSSSVQVFPGKPNIQAIVDEEVGSSIGAIGVSVCGVGAMADEVRFACRSWMGKVNIDIEEESFSW